MTILSKPLDIGAADLRRGVKYSYCNSVDVLKESFHEKTWKQRYVIISQGCVYIYKHHNAKKPKQSYSLSLFSCAEECEPESEVDFCFCLRYKKAHASIFFSCVTMERREKWVAQLCVEITNVQSYNLSADSGYGSAGAVSHHKPKLTWDNYVEVDEIREPPKPDKACDGKLKPAIVPNDNDMKTVRNQTIQTEEVSQDSMSSTSGTSSSFFSIRSGKESQMQMNMEDTEMYVNSNVSNVNRDSGNTSPKTIYENPEELQSAEQHKFTKNEYFCDGKSNTKRFLKTEEDGVFAVYHGESTPYVVCVKTPNGLKCFRVYEQNGMVSLFRSHQINFGSLDELLVHYKNNDLPANDYRVQLLRGYNSNKCHKL